jgi:V/A-type H+-transporting ATPase subunit E
MSVEGIQARIIEDATKEAKEIIDRAQAEARTILAAGKSEAEEYYERQIKLLDEQYRREKERTILSKRLELRKKLLDARQHWMDTAFHDAYQGLVEQDDAKYKNLMIALIGKVSSRRDEEIIFGKKGSQKLLKEIVDGLNKKTGGSFTLSKQRGNFPWGFILRKGSIETNMSIDSLFKYKRGDLEQRAWEIFNADVQS